MLHISFLGQPRFRVDDARFKFAASPKTLPLLAYLLLNRAAVLRRDSLAFTLWPDDTEEDARTALRRHLNYLKNALPPTHADEPWVLADAETVQWSARTDWSFDVAEFERFAEDPSSRADAVELYAGDLLENLYDDWLFPHRERLRTVFLRCLDDLLLESRSRRDFAQAIVYAQRIMAAEPWRENTLRQLITVRYEVGDRAGALREYDEFERRLCDEMGVEPMSETTALRNLIVRNAVLPQSRLTDSRPEVQTASTPPLLRFVGRDAELEQLSALWNRAARGNGATVLVGGEAGIGKSRLASELALRAGAQGARILVGATLFPESVPYEAIAESFRFASPPLSSLDVEPASLAAIAQIVPEVRGRYGDLPTLASMDPARERTRLFEAMVACLSAFAKQRPVLVILEDLHWASAATIAAFEYVARRTTSLNVLILATYREEETASGHPLRDVRRRLQREDRVSHIGLAGLREESMRDLLACVPQFAGGSTTALGAVLERSQGNPLFLAEIIHDSIESGRIADAVPRGLQRTIGDRIARLSESAQFLSKVAAVVGTLFDIDIISEVIGWQEHQVLDALEELVSHHVVRETGKRAPFGYAFSHHLVQRAVYEEIDRGGRARWHRRAAHAMERSYAARLDEVAALLAQHLDLADEPQRASKYYLQAARKALALYANQKALELAKRGLELTSAREDRFALLALLESVHNLRGNREEQAAVLIDLERSTGDDDVRTCECSYRRVLFHRALGERAEENTWIDVLAARATFTGDRGWMACASHARGMYEINIGKLTEARASIDAAIEGYTTTGDIRGQCECLCLLAYLDVFCSKTEESEAAFRRAQAAAESSGNQALLAQTYLMASTSANMRMDYTRCQQLAECALEIYVAIGDREGEADACVRLGVVAGRNFEIPRARHWYAQARDLYQALGKKQGQGAVALNSGLMEMMVGRIDRARESCVFAEQIFSDLGDIRGVTVASINLAMLHHYQGEHAAAKELAQRGLALALELGSEPLQAAALANLGAAERELGEVSASCEHLLASIALREKIGTVADAVLDLAELVLTHVRMDNKTKAGQLADELMALDPAQYATTWAPQSVPIAAARAYAALRQKKRSQEAMNLARRLFEQRLATLPDPEGRALYESILFNRELCNPAAASVGSA